MAIAQEQRQSDSDTLVVAVYLIFSIIFGTIGILVFERETNEGFQNMYDGLWWCLVTITTVGYGDISPITPGGKVIAVVIMFIGLSFYALLTGTISTILIDRTKKRTKNMIPIDSIENHVIICGWNKNGNQLLENLLEDEDSPIVIISDWWKPKRVNLQLHSLNSDPSTELSLTKANIEKAKVVLVLADSHRVEDPQSIDAKTILIALAVANRNSNIHIIVELLNPDNTRHAQNAGVQEVIISGAFTGAMMAQTAASPGLTSVFGQLFGDQTVWLTTIPLPKEWIGQSFHEVTPQTTKANLGALVGVLHDGESKLDPAPETVLTKNDQLILIRSGQR